MPQPPTALIAIVVAVLTAGTAASQGANKAAQTVKGVMQTMTIPASDEIFSAASEPPKDETQWVALRASAATLAESGRLLTTTGPAKEETEWLEMARALVTEAEATLKAIDAKNLEGLAQAGDSLYVTCEACHDRYME
jgi:cytochrome c556